MIFLDERLTPALITIYGLLALATLYVHIDRRHAGNPQLCTKVYAWWIILPIASIGVILPPVGIFILGSLICTLTAIELRPLWRGSRSSLVLQLAGIGILTYELYTRPELRIDILTVLLCVLGASLLLFIATSNTTAIIACSLLATCILFCYLTLLSNRSDYIGNDQRWLLVLFFLTALNDISQFIFGKFIGGRKIYVRISPNKTWAGLVGGIIMTSLGGIWLIGHLELVDISTSLLIAVSVAIAGIAGDLIFSAVKRFLQIKDFSNLIPGHGGILDRIDSLVMTAPLLYTLLLALD